MRVANHDQLDILTITETWLNENGDHHLSILLDTLMIMW